MIGPLAQKLLAPIVLRWAAFLLPVALLAAGIFYSWAEVSALGEQRVAALQQLERATKAASLEDERNALQQALAKGSKTEQFLDANDESKALNLLQAELRDLVTQSSTTFVASRNLSANHEGDLVLPGLRIDVTGTIESIQKLLRAIERHEPYLLTRSFIIVQGGQRNPATNDQILRAQFDVFGAVRPQ